MSRPLYPSVRLPGCRHPDPWTLSPTGTLPSAKDCFYPGVHTTGRPTKFLGSRGSFGFPYQSPSSPYRVKGFLFSGWGVCTGSRLDHDLLPETFFLPGESGVSVTVVSSSDSHRTFLYVTGFSLILNVSVLLVPQVYI